MYIHSKHMDAQNSINFSVFVADTWRRTSIYSCRHKIIICCGKCTIIIIIKLYIWIQWSYLQWGEFSSYDACILFHVDTFWYLKEKKKCRIQWFCNNITKLARFFKIVFHKSYQTFRHDQTLWVISVFLYIHIYHMILCSLL